MTKRSIYLDHNASAPLLPEARAAMLEVMDLTGNPSSIHAHGRALRNAVETARDQVGAAAGCPRRQVVFTGSATEAITQAIVGGVKPLGIDRLVISAGEHAAVGRAAELTGLPLTVLGLDGDGVVRIEALETALVAADMAGETLLVAVHWVNNETGVIQPVGRIEALVGPSRHFLFVDAVQAFGKLPLEFGSRAADMVAVSAHKVGGPTGVGALLMKPHIEGVRLIPGGGQEQGRRGGTEAAMLIAGFGAAAAAFPARYEAARPPALTALFEAGLAALGARAHVFGRNTGRLGNVTNFALEGVPSAVTMMALDLEGFSVSSGSACSSGKVARSHVLTAMGIPGELADCALRVSVGWTSNADEISALLAGLTALVERQRARRGQAA